jgi:hypothetical protein
MAGAGFHWSHATMRTSTRTGFDEPIRVTSPYSTARSSRSCAPSTACQVRQETACRHALPQTGPAGAGGTGEGARFMPEQFGLDQRFGQGRAVHGDQRAVPARGEAMEALGDQFLARPALADHQHRAVELGAARLARSTASRKAEDWPINWMPRSIPHLAHFTIIWQEQSARAKASGRKNGANPTLFRNWHGFMLM